MNLQIQPEAKSTITPRSAGSKVVYMMENESGSIAVEATTDSYARMVSLIKIHYHWGDWEYGLRAPWGTTCDWSVGITHQNLKRTKIGAALFNRNLTASLFIGECTWEGDWGKVRVQRLVFNKLSDKEDTSEVPHCLWSTFTTSFHKCNCICYCWLNYIYMYFDML